MPATRDSRPRHCGRLKRARLSRRSKRFERAGFDEAAALVLGGRILRIGRWQGLDLGAELFGTVLRLKTQVCRLAVVPPLVPVRRHAVDDGVTQPRREQAAPHQLRQVAIAQPGDEHAAVLGLRKGRAYAQASRFYAVAVEVKA